MRLLRFCLLTGFICFFNNSARAQENSPPLVGVEPGMVYKHAVTVQLADWIVLGNVDVSLNGQPYNWQSSNTFDADGDYVIEFSGLDSEGNPLSIQPIYFNIDKTPPSININDASSPGAMPSITVVDSNLNNQSTEIFLDGQSYVPSEDANDIIVPGEHTIDVDTVDTAGNTESVSDVVNISPSCTTSTTRDHTHAGSYLSAVHYFPWHRPSAECPLPNGQNSGWCTCVWGPKSGLRPARGFYDSANLSVTVSQISQMADYGTDIVSIEWGDPAAISNFLNYVVPAFSNSSIAQRNVKFILMYDTNIRLAPGVTTIDFTLDSIRNKFTSDFASFNTGANYFNNPKYFKFTTSGVRPVVYLYVTRSIIQNNAACSTCIKTAFDQIHNDAVNIGHFSDLYLVGDHTYNNFTNDPNNPAAFDTNKLKDMGLSAVTSFAPVDQGVIPSGGTVNQWADKLALSYQKTIAKIDNLDTSTRLVDLMPGIFVQYNDEWTNTAFCGPRLNDVHVHYHLRNVSDWQYMLTTAGKNQAFLAEQITVMPQCNERIRTNNTDGRAIVFTYSYNEWYEGSGMEELTVRTNRYPYGFGTDILSMMNQVLH